MAEVERGMKMKLETLNKLYESAKETAKQEQVNYDEVEIAFFPVVICKSKGKIGQITGVETGIIFENENKFAFKGAREKQE